MLYLFDHGGRIHGTYIREQNCCKTPGVTKRRNQQVCIFFQIDPICEVDIAGGQHRPLCYQGILELHELNILIEITRNHLLELKRNRSSLSFL